MFVYKTVACIHSCSSHLGLQYSSDQVDLIIHVQKHISMIQCQAFLLASLLVLQRGLALPARDVTSQESPFQLRVTPAVINRHSAEEMTLRCDHNSAGQTSLIDVLSLRIVKKSGSVWDVIAEQKDTEDHPTAEKGVTASANIKGDISTFFLQTRWDTVEEESFGVFRCDVTGYDINAMVVTESSPEVAIYDIGNVIGHFVSVANKTKERVKELKNWTEVEISQLKTGLGGQEKSTENEIIQLKNSTDTKLSELKTGLDNQKKSTENKIIQLKNSTDTKISQLKLGLVGKEISTENKIIQLKNSTDTEISQLKTGLHDHEKSTENKIIQLKNSTQSRIIQLKSSTENKIIQLKKSTDTEISRLKTGLDDQEKSTENKIIQLKNSTDTKISQLKLGLVGKEKSVAAVESSVATLQTNQVSYDNRLATLETFLGRLTQWPGGFYALLQPKTGCPVDLAFFGGTHRFLQIHTESQSSSDPSDSHSSAFLEMTAFRVDSKNFVSLEFCEVNRQFNTASWPRGSFCVIKLFYKPCPTGFSSGHVSIETENSDFSGAGRNNVVDTLEYPIIQFCCQNSSPAEVPIQLPTDSPFLLYRYGGVCQKVQGMSVSEEFIRINTEDTFNTDELGKPHPDVDQTGISVIKFNLCYYTKR